MMAERRPLHESRKAIDEAFWRFQDALGTKLATKLTPELDQVRETVFAEVLNQATLPQIREYPDAPRDQWQRAISEESAKDGEIVGAAIKLYESMREKDRIFEELKAKGAIGLTPEQEAIIYEFWRPKEELGDRPLKFPRDYEIAATVHGDDPGGSRGLLEAMQVAESSGHYLVRTGDVIASPSGRDYRITNARQSGPDLTWERLPARDAAREAEEIGSTSTADSQRAAAVKQDSQGWKAIRSRGKQGGSKEVAAPQRNKQDERGGQER